MNNLYYEVRVTELEEKLKKKNDLLSTIRQIKNKLTLKKAFLTLATLTISSAICLCSSLFNPHPNFRRARRFLRSSNEGKIKQDIAKLKERMDSYKELDNKLCNNKEKIKDDKFYNNVIINNYYNDIKKDKVMQRVLKK